MEPRIRTLGILCIAVGFIGAVSAYVVYDRLNGLSFGSDFVPLPSAFVAGWMVVVMLLSIPYLIAGVGLIRLQPWARTAATIVITCGMLSFPFGTALGIYGLWLLTSSEVDEVFSPRFRS